MTTQRHLPSPSEHYGTLRLQVSTALGAFPVENAEIEITSEQADATSLLYRGITDKSGIADGFSLPARPRSQSQNARTAPYSAMLYTVRVTHPSFVPQISRAVALFADTKTILPVVLTPHLKT